MKKKTAFSMIFLIMFILISLNNIELKNEMNFNESKINTSEVNIVIEWVSPNQWEDDEYLLSVTDYSFDFRIIVFDDLSHTFDYNIYFENDTWTSSAIEFGNDTNLEINVNSYEIGDYQFIIELTSITNPARIITVERTIRLDMRYEITVPLAEISYESENKSTYDQFTSGRFEITHDEIMKNRKFTTIIPNYYSQTTNFHIFRGNNRINPNFGSDPTIKTWDTNDYRESDIVFFDLPLPTVEQTVQQSPSASQEGNLIIRIDFEVNSQYDFQNLTGVFEPTYIFQQGMWNFSVSIRNGTSYNEVTLLDVVYTDYGFNTRINFLIEEIYAGDLYEYRLEAIYIGEERDNTLELWMLPLFPLGMFLLIWLPFTYRDESFDALNTRLGKGKYILVTIGICIAIFFISHLIFRFT